MSSTPTDAIADGLVVSLEFTLSDAEGKQLDSSKDAGPLLYLHGAENILPGLEKQLTGKKVGDTFTAVVPPAEAFGEPEGPGPQAVPRGEFPPDFELQPGIGLQIDGPDGEPVMVWVHDVDDETVYLDANHPLAGVTLHFDVEVLEIRAATEDEKAHGHPHGPDGHHHH